LIAFFEERNTRVILLSEYGIHPVQRPIHLNRVLRNEGWIAVREECGLELLDAGASKVFAVPDHQVAHVYIQDPSVISSVKTLVEQIPGVSMVLGKEGKRAFGIDHPRAGELVAVSEPDAWFTYYYWLEDERAPDFARTVDIHRKPGYDPVELFVDPALRFPKLSMARRLLQKKMGFRYLMDVIPLDATLVKGSHGHLTDNTAERPLLMSRSKNLVPEEPLLPTAVHDLILAHVFED
jgi:predicted AlkP superfamily pyrophosphatase or phosphodiesterase